MTQLKKAFVELTEVSRVYKTRSDSVNALSNVSFSIQQGERIALLGRSGSGKSTLLNLLGGMDRPTSGSICVNEHQLADLTSDEMAAYRLTSVGMIFQAFNLIATKSAVQNVEMPFVLTGENRKDRRQKALTVLESVGLKDRAHHRPTEMSGGEQQRVAVARALANKPGLLLADEPTGNLDSSTATDIMQQLVDYSDEHHTTVILVTHDEELALAFAHRTLRLSDGRLVVE